MRKRICTRLAAGLLSGALLLTDAMSMNAWAFSNDLQTEVLEESAIENQTNDTNEEKDEQVEGKQDGKAEEISSEKEEETTEEISNPGTGQEEETENTENTETSDKEEEKSEPEKEQEEEQLKEEQTEEQPGEEAETPAKEDAGTEDKEPAVDEEDTQFPVEDETTGEESVSENTLEEGIPEEVELDAAAVMAASAGDIASGSYGNITWVIDANGKLTVRGTGNYSSTSAQRAPWLSNCDLITSAVIDVTEITSTAFMFEQCSNMISVDLSKLDTSQVKTMNSMFSGCKSLLRLDLTNFDTRQVTNMSGMFSGCSSLTQLTGSHFTTDQVVDMSKMFSGCSSLTQLDLNHFTNSRVENMSQMFYGCSSLTKLNLSFFNTSQVTNMYEMFYNCRALTDLDLSSFNTGKVKNMNAMFFNCSNLKELDLSNFNTENVTDMNWMFYKCSSITYLNLSKFDISKVTIISSMFDGCESLLELDLSSFQTNQLTSMERMFNGCRNLTKLNLSQLDTSQVTSMLGMFRDCKSLTKLDLSHFDTSQVTNMNSMFSGCRGLEYLDLSHFNTANVSNANSMFYDCYGLTTLDLSGFNFSKVTEDQWLTTNCLSLTRIDTPYNIKVSIYLSGRTWYTSDGDEVTEMPKNLDHSVALGLNHIPSVEKPDIPPYEEEQEDELLSKEEKFIEDVTRYSLTNAGEEEKKTIQSRLYDLMFRAYFAPVEQDPDKTVNFPGNEEDIKKYWPYQNGKSSGTVIPDPKLGTVTYTKACTGCLSYARFVSQYVYGSIGRREPATDMSEDNVKKIIHEHIDPGEIIGFSNSKDERKSHFVAFLGESGDGEGFYCLSYGGGGNTREAGAHKIEVKKYTYKEFVNHYVISNKCDEFVYYDTNGGSYFKQSTKKTTNPTNIVMQINCPVEAMIELNEEKLDSRNPGRASFGAVDKNGEQIIFDLNYTLDYKLTISGTDEGTMTVFLSYYDELRSLIDQRKFINIPITASTQVESSGFDHIADFILYVSDENGDISAWGAGPGETVSAPDDSFLPETSFEFDYDDETGVHYKDIPESGEIPNGLWISEVPDVVYTGTAIKPEVRVYDGEKRLKLNKDYTLSYKNNTKAALATDEKPPTVVVKGKGNYSGTETQTFNINKRDIADTYVTKTFTDAYALPTNGKNPVLVFNAKCNKKALKKNTDYNLTVKNSSGNEVADYTDEGTYSVLVKGAGTNYTGEYSFTFDVLNKIPVSKLKINKVASVEYDGKSKRPELVVKYGKVTLNKGTDYTLRYQNNREMGTATITITGKGDYFGTRNVTFTITGRQIKRAKFTGFKSSQAYTGDTLYQSDAILRYGEDALVIGTDYTVSYNNHLNKGKATVTYIGIGNYTGTMKKTYNIAAYNIATDAQNRISLSTDEISAVYTKGGAKPSVKVYDGTLLLTEGKDYTLSYQNNAVVTTPAIVNQPTITVKGKGNYTGVFAEKKDFIITPKEFAEVTVAAPDVAASPQIGKYKSTPVLTDTNGKKLKAGTDYDKTYTYTYKNVTEKVINNEVEMTRNAGDPVEEEDIIPANTVLCVSIKAKEGGNYIGETTAEYRIVASPISKAKITVQNPGQDNKNLFPYTGQEICIDKSNLIVKVGTDVLSDDQYEILEGTYKNNINKGTASVQIRGVGNIYGGTATVKFKIGTKGIRWFWRLFR